MVRPTMSGITMDRRAQVLIGFLLLVAMASSTFFTRWSSTKGPSFTERGTITTSQYLFLVTPAHDHVIGALVTASLVALGRHAPGRYRMTTTRSTSFATTMRMVDGIHHYAANGRTNAAPTAGARLTQGA